MRSRATVGCMSTWNPAEYDEAWTAMAAAGKDPHGEVAFIERLITRRALGPSLSFLDAGCGTGRVAIELAARGHTVQGTDVDSDMLAEARSKQPDLTWTQANLAALHLDQTFDVIVLAGNVMLFVDPVDQPRIASSLGTHSDPGTLVVSGMQLAREDGRRLPLAQFDSWFSGAGFQLIERFATWDEDPFTADADYAVSVHIY
jgi:2-polyprenyl-3-methyl-5-hydroxy-6-metoxy-1,4-benzoquinol methylase